LSQVLDLDRGAQAVSRGAARCASQLVDRGAQAGALGTAMLPQQEEINSGDVERGRVNMNKESELWPHTHTEHLNSGPR
jgi:hypothetical protein